MVPSSQIPGVYHRRIGDIVVTALSDGYLDGTVEVMQNITPGDATQLLTGDPVVFAAKARFSAETPGNSYVQGAYVSFESGQPSLHSL